MKKLAWLLLLASGTSIAAGDMPPLPAHWNRMLQRPDYETFYAATGVVLSHNPMIWQEWHRVVYNEDQKSLHGPYKTRVLLMKIDCGARKATLLRDIRYAADGSVRSDITPDDKRLRAIDYTLKDFRLPDDAIVAQLALVDEDSTCMKGD